MQHPKTDAAPSGHATPPPPFGVTYTPQASTFAVFAEADAAKLRLIHPGTRRVHEFPMDRVAGHEGVFAVEAPGDWNLWSYAYEIVREGQRIADIVDPWARLIRGKRGYVLALNPHPRSASRPVLRPARAIIYELHIQDFTRDPDAGVKPSWRGKYLGLTQPGTTLERTRIATALDHLVDLGVNVVQLMPVHAFAMPYDPEYEWGYMPLHFNAPEPHYAAGVGLTDPVDEFRHLVSTFHERGIRVTLDVVYNHTAETHPTQVVSLMALAPRTYFRWAEGGTPSNGSGTGNEFRSESPQGRRFIIDSCKHWINDFGVDGFRFDLMGLIDKQTCIELAEELHQIDDTILIYGEPWAGGPTPIDVNTKGSQRSNGWGVFNDEFRDALRGEVFELEDRGFLAAGTDPGRTKPQLFGGVYTFADSPLESINYIECHDNHTLADRLAINTRADPRATDEARERMHKLGILMLMCSPGIPFIHAGQEWARSKRMEDNSYDLGNEINNLRWQAKAERWDLYAFHRDAIRMRLKHPIFRPETAEQVRASVKLLDDDFGIPVPDGALAVHLRDWSGRDPWERVLCLYNANAGGVTFQLPEGEWAIVTNDAAFADPTEPLPTADVSLNVPAHSGAILIQPRTQ